MMTSHSEQEEEKGRKLRELNILIDNAVRSALQGDQDVVYYAQLGQYGKELGVLAGVTDGDSRVMFRENPPAHYIAIVRDPGRLITLAYQSQITQPFVI